MKALANMKEIREVLQFHNSVSMVQALGPVTRRNFFVTTKGYIGVCPVDILAGDTISILAGGNCPFALRPSRSVRTVARMLRKEQHYTLVGDYYVQGIVNSEVVKLCNDSWNTLILE